MDAFLHQLRITLRLHFRNRMAILYSYLFPTIFLIAFWVLYRHEQVPLARHMGELLTVTALGGACFGLPTAMVSERERGVWRRYRLAPVTTGALLASTVLARYVLLVLAGLLQVALALLIGMPVPNHPLDLWLAFTVVAFALLGLGLVIATLADNVPAVQALGQCIFLPMLIIGGVAVQLASLPPWAQHVSAFFPGRYAVEAMQASVTGEGVRTVGYSLIALLLIGGAACLAGVKMFRWDAEQRFATRGGKGWIAVALAGWAAAGLLAESRGEIGRGTSTRTQTASIPTVSQPDGLAIPAPSVAPAEEASPDPLPQAPGDDPPAPAKPGASSVEQPSTPPESPPASSSSSEKPGTSAPPAPAKEPLTAGAPAGSPASPSRADPSTPPGPAVSTTPPTGPPPPPASWQDVTPAHIDEIVFERLPADGGVVSPIAPASEPLDPDLDAEMEEVRSRLVTWAPARVADPVQRVRNVLYVAAVPDVIQLPLERHLPHVVFERLREDVPKEDLIKILYWVATHPAGGDDSAVDDLRSAGLSVGGPSDIEQTRERVMLYALKLLGRVTGRIPEG